MSNGDCQKNIKKPGMGWDGDELLISTVAATAAGIFFRIRAEGVGERGALLTSTSLIYLISLPVFRSDDEKTLHNK